MTQVTSYETVKLRSIARQPGLSDTVKKLQLQMAKLTKEIPAGAEDLQELARQANSAVRVAIASEKKNKDDLVDTNKALELVNQLKAKLVHVPETMGYRTGKTDGELVEGWNSKTQKNEFHHPMEWERLIERGGGGDMVGGATR